MSTIGDILADAHEVFCYDREVRPQDRAHAYLSRNRVRRGYDDTAMERVVVDLVERAYSLGASNDDGVIGEVRTQIARIGQAAEAARAALEGAVE